MDEFVITLACDNDKNLFSVYTSTNFVFCLQGTQKWTKRRSIHFQKTTKTKKVCLQKQKSRTSSAVQRITSLSPAILNCCDIHSRKSCILRRCSECPLTDLFLSKPFQACSLLFGNPMWGGISRQQFISSYCTSRWCGEIWSIRNPKGWLAIALLSYNHFHF